MQMGICLFIYRSLLDYFIVAKIGSGWINVFMASIGKFECTRQNER